MITLQEQFEKDFPDKSVREIYTRIKYRDSDFTNYDLDLREYVNLKTLESNNSKITLINLSGCKELEWLEIKTNNLTSIDFLNTLPNPEKLEVLMIYNNKIQPTDISIFSKFVNLRRLKIGTMENNLKKGKHNKFYGSLKSYQNLTKLEDICIEATDVNEGLEYLPESLVKSTRGGWKNDKIECSPHDTSAKCSQIQNELGPFNYDIEAWQLAHPEKMVKVWKEKYSDKEDLISQLEIKITQTQQELATTKTQEADKTKKIGRLESKLKLLEETKTKLEKELAQEQQQHNQTKTNFQSQLRDLATILFPSNSNFDNISFADLKIQAEKIKKEHQNQEKLISDSLSSVQQANSKINQLKEKNNSFQTQLQTKEQELQNKDKETEQLKQSHQKEIHHLETKITKLEQELTNTKQQLKEIQEQLTTSQTANQELQTQITQLESKLKLLEQQKSTYQTKYDKSIEFIKEIREDIAKNT